MNQVTLTRCRWLMMYNILRTCLVLVFLLLLGTLFWWPLDQCDLQRSQAVIYTDIICWCRHNILTECWCKRSILTECWCKHSILTEYWRNHTELAFSKIRRVIIAYTMSQCIVWVIFTEILRIIKQFSWPWQVDNVILYINVRMTRLGVNVAIFIETSQ